MKFFKWLKNLFKKSKDAKEIIQLPPKTAPANNLITIGSGKKTEPIERVPDIDYSKVDWKTIPDFLTSPARPNWEFIAKYIKIDAGREAEVKKIADKIRAGKERYFLPVEEEIGVPWELIGAKFFREGSLDFRNGLHCGQPWNRKTTIVPKGRGPFNSWHDAAIDACRMMGMHKKTSWSFGDCLEFSEIYNGKGYRRKGIYSPYVTAATNFSDEKGKYVRDHVFDPNVTDKRVGVAALMIELGFKDRA